MPVTYLNDDEDDTGVDDVQEQRMYQYVELGTTVQMEHEQDCLDDERHTRREVLDAFRQRSTMMDENVHISRHPYTHIHTPSQH